uniref:ABC-type xenobiotic transporter n=1 Tax=Anisakis simplex TaxID=6269 RepID=A0A0M3KCV2_ANISI
LVIEQGVSPGTVFATFWAVMGGAIALGQAVPQMGAIMGARNAATRIFQIIDRKPEIDSQSSSGSKIDKPNGELEFRDVHFSYPTRPDTKVLDGISVKIPAGKSYAFVGHSGCGKSTLLGLLLRFYEQSSGKVLVDGVPVNELNLRWLRQTIAVVSQEPVLFATTIEENLRLGQADISAEDMERGYKTRIGEGGVQLSGGQKQRLAIARALARDPKVLLLDEATSALDTESERLVQHAIDKASAGRTTLTIAHRLSTIRNADCIVVLDHGKIIESGTHDDLMKLDSVYKQLVKAQEIEKAHHPDEVVIESPKLRRMSSLSRRSTLDSSNASTTTPLSNRKRLSRALSNASASEKILAEIKEEAEQHNVRSAGICEILRFARHEWHLLIFALVASILKGFTFPAFSILYGRMFMSLSQPDNEEKLNGAQWNAIYFTILGVSAGLVTFFGGFLLGWAGESLTYRLRSKLFAHILKQDGGYFDSLEHASGKLTTRLATDAPNIRAAIDQRLADVLQSISAILSGIAIAFSYGPKMAPIGLLTALALISAQTIIAQYLKRRSHADAMMVTEPSRVSGVS